ncbi:hypothetical protein [Gillisia sp. JM1]|uniref:hypothetical protein n=1 Tax=Gillisia sp. JM1 TaxID=1283286 RepID=UPI0003F54342|nr:hypothetical protein [Gillisia sp. JM1]
MISYFHHNKGKLKSCEDSLTAVIFDTLKYLPSDIFWNILKDSLYHDKLPYCSGELISISFWDKWNSNGTTNIRYIEPDVFLRFKEFDIIIEAKRNDKFQQLTHQMEKEITSYFNEYGPDDKNLYFIQLGGLHSKEDVENFTSNENKVIICKTDWSIMLHHIALTNNKLKEINVSTLNAYTRILDDCIKGFALHQFYEKLWLDDLLKSKQLKINPLKQYFKYAERP